MLILTASSAGKDTVYANNGEYTALVKCIPSKAMVFVVASGPDYKVTAKYRSAIINRF